MPLPALNLESVPNEAALLDALGSENIPVPPPGPARTNDHREHWTVCRLLSSLAATGDSLSFPLSVRKGESPDFAMDLSDLRVGLEITEATEREYQKFMAFAEQESDEYFIEPAHFRPNMPRLTGGEMRQLLGNRRLTSNGWQGDEPEQYWAHYVEHAIADKLERLAGYTLHDENWLAVYANVPVSGVHCERAVALLIQRISAIWNERPRFDRLFVETGRRIVRLTPTSQDLINVNDLWPLPNWEAS